MDMPDIFMLYRSSLADFKKGTFDQQLILKHRKLNQRNKNQRRKRK